MSNLSLRSNPTGQDECRSTANFGGVPGGVDAAGGRQPADTTRVGTPVYLIEFPVP
ncbi:hypothetical protein [Micromonospora sp. LOL_015]|uniref:hypothetical protein n=1 Tax=Micromonospora sp. LOL_015 TaxID=3345416 RepID=UPI003A88FEC9